MKTAVVIPSRYASTRLPGKPLMLIKGKPLVQHTIERVMNCKKIDFVAVATDDRRVCNMVKSLGFKAFMTPATCRSGTDRVAFLAQNFLSDCEIFINVQCDEPLIDPELIDTLTILIKNDKSLEYVTAAYPIEGESAIKSTDVVKVVFDKNNDALYFSRFAIPYNRDIISGVKYYKHIGVYGYKRDFLLEFSKSEMSSLEKAENLEQLRALENAKKVKIVIAKQDSLSVDTVEDVLEIEKYL
jgi:3-deoxy-manno-octulosonate cytidylyltransferase (CMP-KDO synthetase)